MESTEMSDPSSKLVLIIDDEESLVELIELVVTKQGFRAERAMDGETGLWKAMHMSPDIILLDLMLPKFGGFEIMAEFKNSNAANVPIIIMTGRYTEESSAHLIKKEYNVRKFLKKPISHQILVGLLHDILKTRPQISP